MKKFDMGYPHDPDDLNRCLILLDAVPEFKPRMKELSSLSDEWSRLVCCWGDIEKSFISEVGLNWSKGHSAPRTHELMRDAIAGKGFSN